MTPACFLISLMSAIQAGPGTNDAPAATSAAVSVETAPGGESRIAASPMSAEASGPSYRLSGDKSIMPLSVTADGGKTYVRWEQSQAMPAVFTIEQGRSEEAATGYMRGGSFVIDGVPETLVFRIDGYLARAKRVRRK